MVNVLKTLKSSMAKVKMESFLSMLCVTCESIVEIFIPFVMAKLIDSGIEHKNMSMIIRYGLFIIAFVLMEALFGFLCVVFATKASSKFAYDLRERLFSKIQFFSFANIDKFSTGSLVTRSTTDIANVQRAFQMLIRGTMRSISMIIFSLIFSFSIDKKIATIFTIMMPLVLISFLSLTSFAMPIFKKMFGAFDELNNVMSENIHGIRVVKTFNREEFEFGKMKKASDNIFKLSVKAEKIIALWDPFMNISVYALICFIAWFGAKAVVMSSNNPMLGLTTGKLMSLITYGMSLLFSLMMISLIFVGMIISYASIERVCEVINEEVDIKNNENPVTTVVSGDIEFKNVDFEYRKDSERYVFKDINIKINSGETIGIIGGTGSGKSTFVNLIPRLYDVTSGSVMVGGVDVREYDLETLRNNVGIVLQKNTLFSGTVRSNLKFGNENATDNEIWEALKIASADTFIKEKENELDYIVEQGGTNFSGGQKQRLSIARTILKNPKIIIFDDSTSAVDTKTDANIREGLKTSLPNTTKIIISQRIISLTNCDRIIVFDNGKIVGFDTHDELVKNCKLYSEIVKLQGEK